MVHFLVRIQRMREVISVCLIVLAVINLGAHHPVVPEETTSYTSILEDPRVLELGKKGLDHLYNMEKEQAVDAFNQIEELYPRHPITPFLKGLISGGI